MGKRELMLFCISILVVVLSFFVFGNVKEEVPMTILQILNQRPNITNVELNDNISGDEDLYLTAENTTIIWCGADVFDIDGYSDIDNARAVLYNNDMVTYEAADDNRYHYTNNTCNITEDTVQPWVNALVNCTFGVYFYANYSEWNCTITVNDTTNQAVNGSDNATMHSLLAIDVVNTSIDWGTRAVDTDYDTDMNLTVENTGNIPIDINLDVYNASDGSEDGNWSFTCQIGRIPVKNIVYNNTYLGTYADSTPMINGTGFYRNIPDFDLWQQSSGTSPTNKSAYFGIRVPGWPTINGTCNGFMRFEALDGRP